MASEKAEFDTVAANESRLAVTQEEDGSRLDRLLLRRLGADKRTLILRLIRKGNVRINGKRAQPESRVVLGDTLFLPASLRSGATAATPGAHHSAGNAAARRLLDRIEILFEDEWLLAVNKPAGLVVHGGSGHEAGLIELLKEQRQLPDLRLAHRLDRDTSGVLLLAKSLGALRKLTESFREREMDKTYLAFAGGHLYPHAGRMQSLLTKGVVLGGERMVIDGDAGQEAITDYQVVTEGSRDGFDFALVALMPHSGRTHQLRVQLQNEGAAILGDNKYGEKETHAHYRRLGGRGLLLHAWRLRFTHPESGRKMELHARWPANWQPLLAALKG